jgi:hypothetical protein
VLGRLGHDEVSSVSISAKADVCEPGGTRTAKAFQLDDAVGRPHESLEQRLVSAQVWWKGDHGGRSRRAEQGA